MRIIKINRRGGKRKKRVMSKVLLALCVFVRFFVGKDLCVACKIYWKFTYIKISVIRINFLFYFRFHLFFLCANRLHVNWLNCLSFSTQSSSSSLSWSFFFSFFPFFLSEFCFSFSAWLLCCCWAAIQQNKSDISFCLCNDKREREKKASQEEKNWHFAT